MQYRIVLTAILFSATLSARHEKHDSHSKHDEAKRNTVTITNLNEYGYERVIVEVNFVPHANRESRSGKPLATKVGYLEIRPVGKKATGNLLDATLNFCQYTTREHHKEDVTCDTSLLEEYFDNNPQNVKQIYIRSINAGKASDYYRLKLGFGTGHGRASGEFAQDSLDKGTLSRSFFIEGHSIREESECKS
jgi:hypothetical protein